MLDMGFHEQISLIIDQLPAVRATWLFSATFPDDIRELSHSIQPDAVEIEAEAVSMELDIKQLCCLVEPRQKLTVLLKILGHYRPDSAIVFCNTRQRCQEVADFLGTSGVGALPLHGEMEQRDRDQALIQFANGSSRVLVATDVAARGLDVKNLGAVINFDVSRELDAHIHRIGRTGRAGESGLAITLYSDREKSRLEAIESRLRSTILRIDSTTLGQTGEDILPARMGTVCIDAGRKEKIRPTDILGALTAGAGLAAEAIGKIDIRDHNSYVAIERSRVRVALEAISQGKIKGRRVKIRKLS
jgi:ATP-independent RNA helicase DbpA